MQARQIAYRLSVGQILSAEYVQQEGWLPNFIKVQDKQVSRLVLESVITNIQNPILANTPSLIQATLQEADATITIRSFDTVASAKDIVDGDFVRVIGRIRKYQEQLYIVPEVIRKLTKITQKKADIEQAPKEVKVDKATVTIEEIIALIDSLDAGQGAASEQVIQKLTDRGVEHAQKRIHNLLLAGDIFEMKPGMIKVLK